MDKDSHYSEHADMYAPGTLWPAIVAQAEAFAEGAVD